MVIVFQKCVKENIACHYCDRITHSAAFVSNKTTRGHALIPYYCTKTALQKKPAGRGCNANNPALYVHVFVSPSFYSWHLRVRLIGMKRVSFPPPLPH